LGNRSGRPVTLITDFEITGMPVATTAKAAESAFEFKARTFTLPTLKLLVTDMERVADSLAQKVRQAPDFFRNTPVVIDLEALAQVAEAHVDFAMLVGLLRGYGMVPIGIRGGNDFFNKAAEHFELAVLSAARPRAVSPPPQREPKEPAAPEPTPAVLAPQRSATKIVTRPVRSGQRVYAPGGDLIVIAPVSAGAELLADGNIHVYGPLRGRALAGVKGDVETRIFCQNLQAELISVAGHYRVSENFRSQDTGRPVQIHLSAGMLVIESL